MSKPADLNRCLAPLDQDHTIIAVIEMSQSSWLVVGVVPGIARQPLKKLAPDPPPQAPPPLARRGGASWPRDQPPPPCLPGWPRWVLVCALAPGSPPRSSCHSPPPRG